MHSASPCCAPRRRSRSSRPGPDRRWRRRCAAGCPRSNRSRTAGSRCRTACRREGRARSFGPRNATHGGRRYDTRHPSAFADCYAGIAAQARNAYVRGTLAGGAVGPEVRPGRHAVAGRCRSEGGVMDQARKLVAEVIGTACLVFFGVGTATLSFGYDFAGPSVSAGVVATALAFGFVVLVLVYGLGSISGCHVNPAVTIGF